MRAMVLEQLGSLLENPRPLIARDVPTPNPIAGHVLIRIATCGVCHTELDEIEGRLPPSALPRIPGHQVIGRIVNLNGDRVMVNTDLFDPNQQTPVDRNKVKAIELSKTSLMPEGLLDYLKEEEIMDLLAYVISGGDPKHEAFKK